MSADFNPATRGRLFVLSIHFSKVSGLIILKFFWVIVFTFACSPMAVAQHQRSYGIEAGANLNRFHMYPDYIVNGRIPKPGFNIGAFVLWDTPSGQRFKTRLGFSSKETFLKKRTPDNCNSPGCQVRPMDYHTNYSFLSLSFAPVFPLTALDLRRFYFLGGARMGALINAKTKIKGKYNGQPYVTYKKLSPSLRKRLTYGIVCGLGVTPFIISGRKMTLEFSYYYEMGGTVSGIVESVGRNRSLELGIGIQL